MCIAQVQLVIQMVHLMSSLLSQLKRSTLYVSHKYPSQSVSHKVSVSHCQYHIVRLTVSVSQCLSHSVHLTVSVSQCPSHSVRLTVSVSQGPSHSVYLTVSVSQCPSHSVRLTVSISQCASHSECYVIHQLLPDALAKNTF